MAHREARLLQAVRDRPVQLAPKLRERVRGVEQVDVRRPAFDVKEAIQWTNIAFMAVCRVINGAATSLGRVPIVLDIYAECDLVCGIYTESEIQEFVDDAVDRKSVV